MNENLHPALINFILGLLLVLFVVGCTPSNDKALSVLNGAGYTEVVLGRVTLLPCPKYDYFNVTFIGVGPSGVKVEGAVCCGLLNNCTIRLD